MTSYQPPTGPRTATEAFELREAMLRNDPDYRAAVAAAEAEREQKAQLLRDAEQPIVAALRDGGFLVNSVWDLVHAPTDYVDALPILLAHLERGGYPDRLMETVGRALAVKRVVAYWDRLKHVYLSAESSRGQQEGAAIALAACATKAEVQDLRDLIENQEQGNLRIYFMRKYRRLAGDEGWELMERLREDVTLGKEADALLRRRSRKQ